jgi:hypothetical protein
MHILIHILIFIATYLVVGMAILAVYLRLLKDETVYTDGPLIIGLWPVFLTIITLGFCAEFVQRLIKWN